MLKEVLIVEGKSDVAAVKRAVEADCITTGGFHFTARVIICFSHYYIKGHVTVDAAS